MIFLKINWKTLLKSVAIPLIVGGISALISMGGMKDFKNIKKPTFTPPMAVFPIAWTILFILMGIAFYLVITSNTSTIKLSNAIKLYGAQLAFNFFWSIWFFALSLYWFSFVWLVALWVLIILTIISFYKISKPAAYLLIPYLLWVTFAGVINFSVALMN